MGVNLAHTHWSKGQWWQVSAGGKPAAAINNTISEHSDSTKITVGGRPTRNNAGCTQKLAALLSKGQLPPALLCVSNLSLSLPCPVIPASSTGSQMWL